MRRSLRIVLATTIALGGCNALLDVKDIYFDPNAAAVGPDGSTDAPTSAEGAAPDGGTEASSCAADLTTSATNCGRCGHDCLQGTCAAGKCQAAQIAAIPNAPLFNIAVSDQYVFVSTRITSTAQAGGIWRVAKTGGNPDLYVDLRYAEQLAVLGDKLYFVVDDSPATGGNGQTGGLYSCPLAGTSPCMPKLIASASGAGAIAVDQNRVFYGDSDTGKGLMVYTPSAATAPTVFRADFGFAPNYFVDGNDAFYTVTISPPNPPNIAKVFQAFTDGGVVETFRYVSDTADDGRLIGTSNAMLFTAYDFSGTTGGVVRRIARDGGTPCSYGAAGNKRPYGIHADGKRVYWSNLGDGPAEPYTNGSLASCEEATCCTVPDILWTGNGHPAAVGGDADAVYFATYASGTIFKIAKP